MFREAAQAGGVVRAQLERNAAAARELGKTLRSFSPRAVVTCARGSSDHAATYGKYLIETRLSGALTKIRSALVVRRAAAGATLRVPVEPAFDGTTITIPTATGMTYTRTDTGATTAQGSTVALADGDSLEIQASPTAGNYFETDQQDSWTFTNPA